MGGYIRLDKDLLGGDPRIDRLAMLLAEHIAKEAGDLALAPQFRELARDAVIGGCCRLWAYADTYLGRHDRMKLASPISARIAEVTGLPASLLQHFPSEWLHEHEDGTIELPGYAAKNGLINRDQRREQGRERTRKWRAQRRKTTKTGDASPSVTPEASQRHQSVTTGTGTGTGPDRTTGTGPDRTEGAAALAVPAGQRARQEPEQDEARNAVLSLRAKGYTAAQIAELQHIKRFGLSLEEVQAYAQPLQ